MWNLYIFWKYFYIRQAISSPGDTMNLTENEKKVIKIALERHLEDVKDAEKEIGQNIIDLAGEVKYERFVDDIIKKLGV